MKGNYLYILIILFVITGCQSKNNALKRNLDEEQKIYINETTKNYGGLIELYKNRLRKSDTQETRFKLAQAYYLSEDYGSSIRILSPVIDNTQDDKMLVLYANILSKMKSSYGSVDGYSQTSSSRINSANYDKAKQYLEKALLINPKNGEAYNLKGIIEVKSGQYDAADYSFNQARDLFYDENKVLNNLSMLAILDKNYLKAYDYLNILYNKGYRNKTVLYNLVFTLIKLNKESVAKELCVENKMSNQPAILIEELKQVESSKTVHFSNELRTTPEEIKRIYETEKNIDSPQ